MKVLLVSSMQSRGADWRDALHRLGAEVSVIETVRDELVIAADTGRISAVLIDLDLTGERGMRLLRALHGRRPLRPVLVVSERTGMDDVIRSSKWGAYEFLNASESPSCIGQAVVDAALLFRSTRARGHRMVASVEGDVLVGDSEPMRRLYHEIGLLAPTQVTVLILGGTGSGKEMVARALHRYSDRSSTPMVVVNCAAIPETLLESELFGHERGAFTGAVQRRLGRFEEAHGGILFLDEVGEMGTPTQAKLLRVLQEKHIRRLGGSESIPVDVRIIAATNADIEKMIEQGRFREDLYYRLSAAILRVPSLAERREDIPALVEHFGRAIGGGYGYQQTAFDERAMAMLCEAPWKGNVRELQNVVRRCMILSRGYGITADVVCACLQEMNIRPPENPEATAETVDGQQLRQWSLEQMDEGTNGTIYENYRQRCDRAIFSVALSRAGGNYSLAAEWLGISRATLRSRMKACGLYPKRGRV